MNNHLMIDLETLGTETDSVFISIGAICFNVNTGTFGEGFYCNVDIQSSLNAGRSINGSTIKWWMKQDKEAVGVLFTNEISYKKSLTSLRDFIHTNKIEFVWSNGSTFDIAMLEHAYKKEGEIVPWNFYSVRDVRTLVSLAPEEFEFPEFIGTKHCSFDDAKHQSKYVSDIWKSIKEK